MSTGRDLQARFARRSSSFWLRLVLPGAFLALLARPGIDASRAAEPDYVQVAKLGGTQGTANNQFDFPYDVEIVGGRLYVADSNNNRVQVFDLERNYLFGWGSTGEGDGQFRRDRGFGVTPWAGAGAALYASDAKNDRVQRFDLQGNFELAWGSIGDAEDEFFRPRGIDVAADSTVIVCDGDNHRVKIFNADLSLRVIIGGRGSATGQFIGPFDCVTDSEGRLYIADTFNHRIQVFDLQGAFITSFGERGLAPGQFVQPKALAVDDRDRLYVAEDGDVEDDIDRIQKLTRDGTPITQFGAHGAGVGQLRTPVGLAVDPQGQVYVADSANHRVTIWAQPTVPSAPRSMGGLKGAFGRRP